MSLPKLSDDTLRDLATAEGVCVRPILTTVTDTMTGESSVKVIPCGSTRESVCPSCATRARRLRMHQCREGWHLTDEPTTGNDQADDEDDDQDDEDATDDDDETSARRVRSTRRRDDADELPRPPKVDGTLGRTFTGKDGQVYRPSTFLTLTMPSYGQIRDGAPVNPATYDYRRAALDALHFSKLVDRFWQNARRATGQQVQYFATVEPQRRLAPHLHAAIRGTYPRALIRQIAAATYHQVWWPRHDEPVFTDYWPVWVDTEESPTNTPAGMGPDGESSGGVEARGSYVDPATGEPLPTWDQALDATLDDIDPAHVVRFGRQVDIQGVIAGSKEADRGVGYLTKYLTKSISDDLHDDDTPDRAAHVDRLHQEVRWLPCSPTCANWLRYGVQPKNARPGLEPGYCTSKAHDREHLGLGGRRVLVSRKWTGKTLTDHRADRAAVVREALEAAGVDMDNHNEYSATATGPDRQPRFVWTRADPDQTDAPSYMRLIAAAISQKQRWRAQYDHAKTATDPPAELSATTPATA